jgi:hypothetical protein
MGGRDAMKLIKSVNSLKRRLILTSNISVCMEGWIKQNYLKVSFL